jgi:hypothetical protein
MSETPRTDALLSSNDGDFERGIALCRELELENRDLRILLNQALARLFKLNNDIENGEV